MAVRKVLTKKEAEIEAYHIAKYLDGKKIARIGGLINFHFSEVWDGKWKDAEYRLWNNDFYISFSRIKHTDGRIRDAYSDTENLIFFALFVVQHFPQPGGVRLQWHNNLMIPELVKGTLEKAERRFYEHPLGGSFHDIEESVRHAQTLAKLTS
ncbi:hypothetical protein [Aquisediminimonas sediminicola]|uniref:hypothetical protein n=1 Tax=Alteraquisediminimonas sediminicola TaxID=2676787 RepID=UPI001C8E6D09|nr:hypothetical protein [Aquisediminimonas sediminicola]